MSGRLAVTLRPAPCSPPPGSMPSPHTSRRRSIVMSDEAQEARRALQESMDRRDQGSND